jgi:hypothetical protein
VAELIAVSTREWNHIMSAMDWNDKLAVMANLSFQFHGPWQTGLDQLEVPSCARSQRYKSRRDMRSAHTAVAEQAWQVS